MTIGTKFRGIVACALSLLALGGSAQGQVQIDMNRFNMVDMMIDQAMWKFPEARERHLAAAEIARACPAEVAIYSPTKKDMLSTFQGLWGTYDISGFYRHDPANKYGCFNTALRRQWQRVAANMSPALVDFRQKCAAERQAWVRAAMGDEGPSNVSEAEVYAITDLYLAMLGTDPAAIQSSLDRSNPIRQAHHMPHEIALYDCTGQVRIQQLTSGQNAALSGVFE